MIAWSLPTALQVERFIKKQADLSHTYTSVGHTAQTTPVPDFDNDQFKINLGYGDKAFEVAKTAIQHWQMFPNAWTRILPADAPIQENTTIAMYARFAGIWWRNACRIVYVIDKPRHYGFAYGTLPGHVESGEELFHVFQDESGAVWYEIRAFSRPRHWLVKLGYPLVRLLQVRFRRDSARQMKELIMNDLIMKPEK